MIGSFITQTELLCVLPIDAQRDQLVKSVFRQIKNETRIEIDEDKLPNPFIWGIRVIIIDLFRFWFLMMVFLIIFEGYKRVAGYYSEVLPGIFLLIPNFSALIFRHTCLFGLIFKSTTLYNYDNYLL